MQATRTIKRSEEGHASARKAVEGEDTRTLRVGRDRDAAPARIADFGYGDIEDLDDFYARLPADYEGGLPLRELALMDQLNSESVSGSNGYACLASQFGQKLGLVRLVRRPARVQP